MKPLITLDIHRKKFQSDAEAARDLELDYFQYHRWINRKTFADNTSRKLLALKGVSLPERQKVRP